MTKEEILRVLKANLEWQHYTDGNDSWDSELKQAVTEAIKILEQQPSDDCVSRQAILDKIKEVCFSKKWVQFRVDNGSNGQRDFLINYIEQLPSMTPIYCVAEVRFSKEDLREICNERIEIECTHGTCKDRKSVV